MKELNPMHTISMAAAVSILLAWSGADLHGQLGTAPPPGGETASVALLAGAVAPRTTFDDGSSFSSGGAMGVSVTGWASHHLGFRANVLRGKTDGENGLDPQSAIAVNDPVVWFYMAEVVLRRPMESGFGSWFPYLSGGAGGKNYSWAVKPSGDTAAGWTAAGGIELRPSALGRLGVMTELRHYRSQFKFFGHGRHYNDYTGEVYGSAQNADDLVISAGITATF